MPLTGVCLGSSLGRALRAAWLRVGAADDAAPDAFVDFGIHSRGIAWNMLCWWMVQVSPATVMGPV